MNPRSLLRVSLCLRVLVVALAFGRLLILTTVASAGSMLAQEPRLSNAKLQIRSAAAGLEREFRSLLAAGQEPAWVGYSVPKIPGEHHMCCSSGCCGECRLEGGKSDSSTRVPGPVRLEGGRQLLVLYRIEQGRVDKIRSFSEECELDAGGLAFHWLTGVGPEESIAWLSSFATALEKEGRRLSDSAVTAIAFHNGPAADRTLEQFMAAGQPESLRERAAFWLGNARGRRGYEILRQALDRDPSDRVREKIVFALSQSKEPEALTSVIETARNDKSSRVRGQALFWLGQRAGKRAAEAITEAIEMDPETEVKKKAVFALSQLPRDEGIPMLIQVARTNRNPAVRRQAIFWLGQSKDARALAFFEEILTR
jgi:HEAT repeats